MIPSLQSLVPSPPLEFSMMELIPVLVELTVVVVKCLSSSILLSPLDTTDSPVLQLDCTADKVILAAIISKHNL